MRKLVAFLGVLALTACGSVESSQNGIDQQAWSAGSAALHDTGEAELPSVDSPDPANPGFTVGSHNGDYYRISLPLNHEVIHSVHDLVTPETRGMAPIAEIEEAVRVAAAFSVEELVDSELAFSYSPSGAKAWWAEHSHIFTDGAKPVVRQDFLSSIDDSRALLYTDRGWSRGKPLLPSRITDLTIELTSLDVDEGRITPTFAIAFNAPVIGAGGSDDIFVERTLLTARYDMVKDGEWLIDGYETSWQSTYRLPDMDRIAEYSVHQR